MDTLLRRRMMMGGGSSPTPPTQYTIVVYPSSYDQDNIAVVNPQNIENGYAAKNSSSYAQLGLVATEAYCQTYFYYKFDLSQIPAGATIDSVTLDAKGSINSSLDARVRERYMVVCNGTTPVGTASEKMGTTPTIYNLDTGSGWTASNISNIAVKLFAERGSQGLDVNIYFRFYGADLTITYTI